MKADCSQNGAERAVLTAIKPTTGTQPMPAKNAYEIGYEAGVINFTPNPRVFIPRATAQDCAEFARGWHAGHGEIEVDRRVAAIEAFFNCLNPNPFLAK